MGMGGQHQAAGTLSWERDPVPVAHEAASPPPGFYPPFHPVHSESQY